MGHPSKFQRVSLVGFVTAATSLNGGQANFAQCLAVSCSGTLYIHFAEFCHVQNSFCVQLLRSPVLAALLHGTRAVGVSESLRRRTRNGITELSQTAPPIFVRAAIMLGIGPHSSINFVWSGIVDQCDSSSICIPVSFSSRFKHCESYRSLI